MNGTMNGDGLTTQSPSNGDTPMSYATKRLKEAREQSRKTPHQIAMLAHISSPNYYDLEAYDDEIKSSISLRDLYNVCASVGFRMSDLFSREAINESLEKPNDFGELLTVLLKHLDNNK